MSSTPDLPPGARSRMWWLFAATVVTGVGMYAFFERTEGLWLSVGVLSILLYLLIGVRLTIKHERAEITPTLNDLINTHKEPFWVIVDVHTATVLHLTDLGARDMGHSRSILHGQRLTDLTEDTSTNDKAVWGEMLRYGKSGVRWQGVLVLKDETGVMRHLKARLFPILHENARRQGLIVLGPQR